MAGSKIFISKGAGGSSKRDAWEFCSAAVKSPRSGTSANASPWGVQWLRPSLEGAGSAVCVQEPGDFSNTLGLLASVTSAECPVADNTGEDRSALFPY